MAPCVVCQRTEGAITKCTGCQKEFCTDHISAEKHACQGPTPIFLTEDFTKAFKAALPQFAEFLSMVTGTRVTVEDEKMITDMLTQIGEFGKEWLKQDFQKMSEKEIRKAAVNLWAYFIRMAFQLDKETEPFQFIMDFYSNYFEDQQTYTFLAKTNYATYKSELFKIADDVVAKGKHPVIQQVFGTMPQEDYFALNQRSQDLVANRLSFLETQQQPVSKELVEKYIEVYRELAAFMEKMVMQLLGIKQILDGKQFTYSDLTKSALGNNIRSLEDTPHFTTLVKPLNVTVRNSIAHGSTVFDPIREEVQFIDKKNTVKLKYEDFIAATEDLAATTMLTSKIELAISHQKWKLFMEELKKSDLLPSNSTGNNPPTHKDKEKSS